MKIVLDSNVLLVAIGKRSRYRPIWDGFVTNKYQLIITEEILHEYEEILNEFSAPGAAQIIMQIFTESQNIDYRYIYYTWNAITGDSDDNKFFDAAVAGIANYLVTNDTHFNEAKKIKFPKVKIITASQFLNRLSNLI